MTVSVAPDTTDELFAPPAPTSENRAPVYFGEITLFAFYDVAFDDTQRRFVPFDPRYHAAEAKRINIKIQLLCRRRDGSTYTVEQECLNTGSRKTDKWGTTLPSLTALGVTTRSQLLALKGQYAQLHKETTGKKYQAKKTNQYANEGDWLDELAFVFKALYPTQEACSQAEAAFYKRDANTPAYTPSGHNDPQALPDGEDPGRALALQALPMLWQAAGRDVKRFEALLAQNPMLNKYLTMGSPEVVALMPEL